MKENQNKEKTNQIRMPPLRMEKRSYFTYPSDERYFCSLMLKLALDQNLQLDSLCDCELAIFSRGYSLRWFR